MNGTSFNLEEVKAMISAVRDNPLYSIEGNKYLGTGGIKPPMDTFTYSKVDDHKIIENRVTPDSHSVDIHDITV